MPCGFSKPDRSKKTELTYLGELSLPPEENQELIAEYEDWKRRQQIESVLLQNLQVSAAVAASQSERRPSEDSLEGVDLDAQEIEKDLEWNAPGESHHLDFQELAGPASAKREDWNIENEGESDDDDLGF